MTMSDLREDLDFDADEDIGASFLSNMATRHG